MRLFFAIELTDLALLAPMNPRGRPARFPLGEPRVLGLERLEGPALQGGTLRVLNRRFDGALAIGIPHTARVGDDAVVREHRRVDRVEARSVPIGPHNPLFQVVEHRIATGAAERPKRLFMQLRPHHLRRLPHHLPKALARILERHDEQDRALILARRRARRRALAIVDLRLFAGQNLEHIETLRRTRLERGHEAFDGVVLVRESVPVDQILKHTHGVAAKRDLRFDPRPMRLAGGRRGAGADAMRHQGGRLDPVVARWPGWGHVRGQRGRAGGHPGGICGGGQRRPGVAPNRFPIHAGPQRDLMLGRAPRQQRGDRNP